MTLSDSRQNRRLKTTLRPLPSSQTGLPRLPASFRRAVPTTPADRTGACVDYFPLARPSPNGRRVGIRIVTFEACSSFTHVTARRIAQPPKATFVARLQPCRLPDKAARQLPYLSTTIRVGPSPTGDPRLRGARPLPDIRDTTQRDQDAYYRIIDLNAHFGSSAKLATQPVGPLCLESFCAAWSDKMGSSILESRSSARRSIFFAWLRSSVVIPSRSRSTFTLGCSSQK